MGRYFTSEGLGISPLRVVTRDTFRRAYGGTPGQGYDNVDGRNAYDRSIIIENKKAIQLYGEDYVLGVALHEAAHSTGGQERIVRTVQEHSRGINISRMAIAEYGLEKVDLRKNTEHESTGGFWEEAFADLTRVRALRTLGRTRDINTETKPLDTKAGVAIWGIPNGNNPSDYAGITIPAEFISIPQSTQDIDKIGTNTSNFAAYALELLDKRVPGLYEDLKAARTNPLMQKDAIQKIESVQPGLYRKLSDLEYSEKDFIRGLTLTSQALDESKPT